MDEKKQQLQDRPKYDKDYLIYNITDDNKKKMKEELSKGIGFIV